MIPETVYPVNRKVPGSWLLSKGVTELEGCKIEPNRFYHFESVNKVNHNRRMKELFKRNGEEAVRQYVDEMIQLHKESQSVVIDIVDSMNDRAKSYSI